MIPVCTVTGGVTLVQHSFIFSGDYPHSAGYHRQKFLGLGVVRLGVQNAAGCKSQCIQLHIVLHMNRRINMYGAGTILGKKQRNLLTMQNLNG
jgi:hypothetical protein